MQRIHISEFDPRAIRPGTKEILSFDVATTPGGMVLRHTILAVAGYQAGPVLVISGGVHGDEYEGPLAIMRLFHEFEPTDFRGTVIGLPMANVPAFDAATRVSPIDGLNLARVFPGRPDGSITEQIAYWMAERLIAKADFYIDLHSSGSDGEMVQMCGYNYGHGPVADLRRRVAEAFHAHVVWAHPGPQPPGRTLSYAFDHNIPAVYTESPPSRTVSLEDVAVYQRGVRNAMRVLGMLDGTLEGNPSAYYLYGAGDTDSAISTTRSGYFLPEKKLLDWVEAGEILGRVFDLAGRVIEEIRAPVSGYVGMRQLLPTVHAGKVVFMLAGRFEDREE